jgi:HD-GYP domain-containing protein (c-di-GMP phosphodiesterase class II)
MPDRDPRSSDVADASAAETRQARRSARVGLLGFFADPRFMRGHARRVAFYSGLVAERMGLAGEERESLRFSAFLHDLGKVGVPADLLLQPGALAPDERRIVEQHPVIGSRLLGGLDVPSSAPLALRHHHEWWNGSGYPDGLAGERIPLAARIIGVADAFDAMTSDRPYRRALGRELAVAELRRCAGVQFDPEIARELLACLAAGRCDSDPRLPREAVGAAAPRAA